MEQNHNNDYIIEMLHITKEFPGIKANDDITLQLRRGEIHALLGENGAGKSTLMSVLFGLYQPEKGEIRKNGVPVKINDPNDATALGIGMVHQHFKLIDVFTVLDNIILGAEDTKLGFLQKKKARQKVKELSEKYGLAIDMDAKVEDITVGMQQRVEILKMLYRDNEILIFDEPTAVLTPQEIDELMEIMRSLAKEGGGGPLHRTAQGQICRHHRYGQDQQAGAEQHDGGPPGPAGGAEIPGEARRGGAGGRALFRAQQAAQEGRRARCDLYRAQRGDLVYRGH